MMNRAMELWNHCENPYPFVPAGGVGRRPAVRASLPNKYCEPEIAARFYEEVFEDIDFATISVCISSPTNTIPGSTIFGPRARLSRVSSHS